jgi:hypothetical protein
LLWILTIAGILYLVHWWNGPLRFLQFHASDVHDDYNGDGGGWTGDFSRRISARCSEATFHEYAAQQDMTTRLDRSTASTVRMSWGGGPRAWWTPPKNLEGAYYYYREGGSRRLLAWSDGRLYYDIEVW